MQSTVCDNIRTAIGKRGSFSKKMVWLMLTLLLIASWIAISVTNLSAISDRMANEPHSHSTVDWLSSHAATTGTLDDRLRPFCQPWSSADAYNRTLRPFDRWHTHHPTWFVVEQTDDRFCVAPSDGTTRHPHVGNLLKIYANQFHASCDAVHVRPMWSSGWGADFFNMQAGVVHAMTALGGVPLVMEDGAWHYAANKDDGSNPTCPAADVSCYFLPYHGCGPLSELVASSEILDDLEDVEEIPDDSAIDEEPGLGRSAYFFFAREQLWLRRAVFDYARTFRRERGVSPARYDDCTAMHVRRSDVILHDDNARRYFPVEDYVARIPPERLADPRHYVFLLTDDANAVDEAEEFFPGLEWKYLDRPRHRGSSGGWENQTPSRDPRLETVVLLATFELAKDCSAFVHGQSGFADHIYQQVRRDVQRSELPHPFQLGRR